MNIELAQGEAVLALNGGGVTGAVSAARFTDGAMNALEVGLQGPPADLAASASQAARWLSEAARTFRQPSEEWVFVRVSLPDGSAWRSPLRGGRATLARGAAGRHLNTSGLRLELEREAWWEESQPVYAALSNRHGASAGPGGLVVHNHHDAGHENFVDVDTVGGDLPAPAVLTAVGSGMGGVEAHCGLAAYALREHLQGRYDAEAGSSGAGVTPAIYADAACSGGAYVQLAWSGSAEMLGRSWDVAAAESGAFNGRVYRPLVRLQSAIGAGEKLWVTLQVGYNFAGTVEPVARGESVLAPEARMMLALPALQLPPWPVLGGLAENLELSLLVQAETGGAHSLNVDQMLLLPADSFLHLLPAVASYPNFDVEFDSQSGLMKNNGFCFASHIAEGPGIWLVPGRAQRLCFAFRQGAGWNIHHAPVVNLRYRRRKQVL